jgi:site-specific recombinase XerD
MNTKSEGANRVRAIRDIEKIKEMKAHLYGHSSRNGFLFLLGINSGLKISDLLPLKVVDVKYASHLKISARNGDFRWVKMLPTLKAEIEEYTKGKEDEDYLFPSREGNKPITRVTAWNILKSAATAVGINESIGTTTLRKTYGYHYYQQTKDLAELQQIFGHSSVTVTKEFIEINEDIS